MYSFTIKIADIVLEINAFNESTKRYCASFFTDEEPDFAITMTEEDLINEPTNSNDIHAHIKVEISALYRKIADLFVEEDVLVFHGSSFMVNNNGFIVTARSGVGKSTHVNLLKQLLKDELVYINDDKPLLEIKDDVTIFSNPWNGKERRGNNINAPLKAILFLNRSEKPSYQKIINKQDIYIKLMSQTYLPKEKSKREKALKLVDNLLKKIDFYEINVNINIESAKMSYEEIIKNEIK